MPLKKLWNSLRGVTPQPKVTSEATPVAPAAKSSAQADAGAAKTPVAKTTVPVKASPAVAKAKVPPAVAKAAPAAEVPVAPKAKPASRGVLSMLSRGEHDALVKLLSKQQPSSVLEVGVGDGSRTPAIVHSLTETQPELKYAVIDQFEMVGGILKLRDFHGQLVGLSIRPSIIPEPAARGIVTVLHRLGMMDAIILDPSLDSETLTEIETVIGKVSHADTTILRQTNGKWAASASTSTTLRSNRRAA
ncbi:hypothetical protein [Rhodopirellula halodulae]|uniref:hypothetical protein n=1 Tax=Rhodopirellula halodulae TaxID=2894198 RepID=UPI001E54F0AA|nr:hypothetical protein [Rhodopirellula sp. JC737]